MKKLAMLALLLFTAQLVSASVDIQLSWDANPVSDGVTAYKVYQALGVATQTSQFSYAATTMQTSQIITLPNPGAYSFYVSAVNFWGLESPPSNILGTPVGVPGAPHVVSIKLIVP